jgi:hypothetical protein
MNGNPFERQDRAKHTPTSPAELLNDASGGDLKTLRKFEAFVSSLPELPTDPYAAATEIRRTLIHDGYRYETTALTLQDILKRKAGNCLSLSALIGAALEMRGFSPEYEVIMNPHDAIYRMDLKLFEALQNGEYFQHDNPPLSQEISEFHDYRFVPLEHPALLLEGKRFETTSLEEELHERPTDWAKMTADRTQKIHFKELCGAMLVDRARILHDYSRAPYEDVRKLLVEGIRAWPMNREAYATAKEIAEANFDDGLRNTSGKRYEEIGGDDPRFHFTMYEWFGDAARIDRALELYPAYMPAYVAKNVDLAKSERDARFSFSVAAYCYANSGELDLRNLYIQYGPRIMSWIGQERYGKLAKKLGLKKYNPYRYAMALAEQGHTEVLIRTVRILGWPHPPKEQVMLANAGKGADPIFAERLKDLREKYGQSDSFNAMDSEVKTAGK